MGESKIPFTIVDIVQFLQTVRRGGTNLLFLKSVIFSEMASCKVLSQMRLFIGPNQIFKRMKENGGRGGALKCRHFMGHYCSFWVCVYCVALLFHTNFVQRIIKSSGYDTYIPPGLLSIKVLVIWIHHFFY